MDNSVIETLHDIHTATNDVLKGYSEMESRSKPDILPVIRRLTDMHQKHANELVSELRQWRETGEDDTSLQGTLNKVVVVLRDWIADLDRDALPAVRQGEESLRDKYVAALQNDGLKGQQRLMQLLQSQHDEIVGEISRLPKT